MLKIYRYSYFYNGKSDSVFRFSLKPKNIKKKNQNEYLSQFSDKRDGKSDTQENLPAETRVLQH